MDRERIRSIVQLDAMFQSDPVRLNDVFDTLAIQGMLLEDLAACTCQDLVSRIYFSPEQAERFVDAAALADRVAGQMDHARFTLITRADAAWPGRVRCPPANGMMPWLFLAGDLRLLDSHAIGVGGSRNATSRSLDITRMLVEQCVQRGVSVISGGARGIDDAAHRTALEHDGITVVVLAQGIGTFTIPSNWRIPIEQGRLVVVSEFSPFAGWESHQAIQRNGTVVRLSEAFVVVQAELKSGTSSAGRSALRMKRPLHVVSQAGPGAERFEGSEQLIADGGTPLTIPLGLPFPAGAVDALLETSPATEATPDQMRLF